MRDRTSPLLLEHRLVKAINEVATHIHLRFQPRTNEGKILEKRGDCTLTIQMVMDEEERQEEGKTTDN
jgi:hypothetical protein